MAKVFGVSARPRAGLGSPPAARKFPDLTYRPAWGQETALEKVQLAELAACASPCLQGCAPGTCAPEPCILAYDGEQLVAASCVRLTTLPAVRRRVGMFSALMAPSHRSFEALSSLARFTFAHLEAWSAEHPEAALMGMAAVTPTWGGTGVEASDLPAWPMRLGYPATSGLTVIGHTRAGHQLRLAWFDHARLR